MLITILRAVIRSNHGTVMTIVVRVSRLFPGLGQALGDAADIGTHGQSHAHALLQPLD